MAFLRLLCISCSCFIQKAFFKGFLKNYKKSKNLQRSLASFPGSSKEIEFPRSALYANGAAIWAHVVSVRHSRRAATWPIHCFAGRDCKSVLRFFLCFSSVCSMCSMVLIDFVQSLISRVSQGFLHLPTSNCCIMQSGHHGAECCSLHLTASGMKCQYA